MYDVDPRQQSDLTSAVDQKNAGAGSGASASASASKHPSRQAEIETRLVLLQGMIAQTVVPFIRIAKEPHHTPENYQILIKSLQRLVPLVQHLIDLDKASHRSGDGVLGVLRDANPREFARTFKHGRKITKQDMAELRQILQVNLQQQGDAGQLEDFYLSQQMAHVLFAMRVLGYIQTDKRAAKQLESTYTLLSQLTMMVHELHPNRQQVTAPSQQVDAWLRTYQINGKNPARAQQHFESLSKEVQVIAQAMLTTNDAPQQIEVPKQQQRQHEAEILRQGSRQAQSSLFRLGEAGRGPIDLITSFLGDEQQYESKAVQDAQKSLNSAKQAVKDAAQDIVELKEDRAALAKDPELTGIALIRAERQLDFDIGRISTLKDELQKSLGYLRRAVTQLKMSTDKEKEAAQDYQLADTQVDINKLQCAAPTLVTPKSGAKVNLNFRAPEVVADLSVVALFITLGLASVGTLAQFWFVPVAIVGLAGLLTGAKYLYEYFQHRPHQSVLAKLTSEHQDANVHVMQASQAELCDKVVHLPRLSLAHPELGADMAFQIAQQQQHVAQVKALSTTPIIFEMLDRGKVVKPLLSHEFSAQRLTQCRQSNRQMRNAVRAMRAAEFKQAAKPAESDSARPVAPVSQ